MVARAQGPPGSSAPIHAPAPAVAERRPPGPGGPGRPRQPAARGHAAAGGRQRTANPDPVQQDAGHRDAGAIPESPSALPAGQQRQHHPTQRRGALQAGGGDQPELPRPHRRADPDQRRHQCDRPPAGQGAGPAAPVGPATGPHNRQRCGHDQGVHRSGSTPHNACPGGPLNAAGATMAAYQELMARCACSGGRGRRPGLVCSRR